MVTGHVYHYYRPTVANQTMLRSQTEADELCSTLLRAVNGRSRDREQRVNAVRVRNRSLSNASTLIFLRLFQAVEFA